MYTCIYIYIYIHIDRYIYIYICIERERWTESHRVRYPRWYLPDVAKHEVVYNDGDYEMSFIQSLFATSGKYHAG